MFYLFKIICDLRRSAPNCQMEKKNLKTTLTLQGPVFVSKVRFSGRGLQKIIWTLFFEFLFNNLLKLALFYGLVATKTCPKPFPYRSFEDKQNGIYYINATMNFSDFHYNAKPVHHCGCTKSIFKHIILTEILTYWIIQTIKNRTKTRGYWNIVKKFWFGSDFFVILEIELSEPFFIGPPGRRFSKVDFIECSSILTPFTMAICFITFIASSILPFLRVVQETWFLGFILYFTACILHPGSSDGSAPFL